MKKSIKKAFTLAEIMIVLTIIGILTAILLPNALRSTPDENVLKFKKAHNNLKLVINQLISDDKYYFNGDLGRKPDGTLLDRDEPSSRTYFCETLADVLSTKSVNCSTADINDGLWALKNDHPKNIHTCGNTQYNVTNTTIQATKKYFDEQCKSSASDIGPEIITTDNITYYGAGKAAFGYRHLSLGIRYFSSPEQETPNYCDKNGSDIVYKVFCIDVDGIDTGEDPFGYGIRADGKILSGARADEWVEKSATKKE